MNPRFARLPIAALLLLLGTACTGGINAGRQGGQAFIALTLMLLAFLFIMWLIIGRER